MYFFKTIFESIAQYRQFIIREAVKIAVVAMEAGAVYLILKIVYEVEEYSVLSSAIFTVIAYLVSWMQNKQIKKTFAIAYTAFALIAACLNLSRDYYKSVESNQAAFEATILKLQSQLKPKVDLGCGKSVDEWAKIHCVDKQIRLDSAWIEANSDLLAEIKQTPKPTHSIASLPVTTFFRWLLVLLIAIAPGFLFLHVSTEDARIIESPVEIPKTLPDSFNQFAELLEKHFGFKKTTVRDWLRSQGWIQPSDRDKIVEEATKEHLSTIALLREHIAERQL